MCGGRSTVGGPVRWRPHQVVPSGKATTVWPARNRRATVVHHRGQAPQTGPFDRDDLSSMRATIPLAHPVNMSARATNEPGNTEPMVKTSNQEICGLTTKTPRRFRIGLPDTVIRTPRQRSTNRQ